MPFAKRIVEPQLLCRHSIPNDDGQLFEDLCSINNVALSRTLRQLSDLAKHACSIFQELESDIVSTNQRVRGLQTKIGKLQQSTSGLDPKQEAVPVSDLDVESKLTAHYQAPWHQQRNVFHPSTRPTCVEELHWQAKQSLRVLHRDHHQRQRDSGRERRVTISVAPPMPTYPSPRSLRQEQRGRHLQTQQRKPVRDVESQLVVTQFESTRSSSSSSSFSSSTECCHFSPWSKKAAAHADPDDEVVALGHRPKCPIPNVPSTLDKQTNWSRALPLPTPEERMKTNSKVITSCVIPINVTGVGFDRDASVRCSLVHSQSVLQRRRKLRRRKTITGIPRQVQQDLDSDESPVARERTVIVHTSPDLALCNEDLSCRLGTKDSGCQTEESLIAAAAAAAPSRRRIRAQRGQGACVSLSLSHSTGNISALPDGVDAMFSASVGARLRSRSLPREGGRLADEGRDDDDSDEDDDEEELSPYEAEDFLSGPGELILKDEEESTDDQAAPDHQLASLKYSQHPGSPDHGWMDRGRSRMPRKADLGSCEISSSSDTFSSPIHSASTTGVLGGPMDHKEDHQSSSGNWSGSSSTCPSQTSETIPPAASPPLTGSSHCDSELSLNAGNHAGDDPGGFIMDPYQSDRLPGLRAQRAGSFSSTAMDLLEDAGVSTASEGEWTYPHPDPPCPHDFSPEHSREPEGSLGCPSFASMATYESLSDKPSSEKDTASHYSIDTEGYYTSMHFDCGLKGSKSFTYNYAPAGSDSQSDISGHGTLGRRCLSLRKPKVKPSPPRRSSSLRKINSEAKASDKSEPKITSGQQPPSSSRERKLQLALAGAPDQAEGPALGGDFPEAWGVGGRDETPGLFGSTDTRSFKDEGAVQSDYADLWLLNDLKSNSDPYRSLSNSSTATGTTVIECIKSQECLESQTSQSGSRATTPSLPSVEGDFKLASPDKLAGLASPSSGYSSQSETPTSSFPSTFFPGPLSPSGGKRKPKVPERKSSLSSLQHSLSSGELELPIIAPTHLDLSALHNVISKPSAYRNPMHIPNESRQKAVVAASVSAKAEGQTRAGKAGAAANSEGPASTAMAITPMVLRSVQLRSVGKQGDGGRDWPSPDTATRPKCPTVNIISPTSSSKTSEPRKPPAYDAHHSHSQEFCESLLSPQEGPAARAWQTEVRFRHDRLAPVSQWSMTAFKAPGDQPLPDQELSQSREGVTEGTGTSEAEEMMGRVSAKAPPSPSSSSESELNRSQSSEPSDEDPLLCPAKAAPLSAQHSLTKRSDSLDKVPVTSDQGETSQAYPISDVGSREVECESSGVAIRSASQDSGEDGSTPDTEDYIIKESTPGDNGSPLTEEQTKAEDDSVFLSPTKTRTTEDLFAMIHRSKRKVLGRKDSGELSARNRSAVSPGTGSTPPGTPATPPSTPLTPASPMSPTGPHKTPGPIYRSARKSSTSNEEFKLLLLKKGSRSDSSYRMSATEILKSPVSPKPPGDLLWDGARQLEELLLSPTQQPPPPEAEQIPGPFPKANAEGFSPKALPTSAASRQGRSRIPPPANSSRYSIRSRLYIAPMQAISEGETENSDGSPHDDRSSQGSS